MGIEAGESIAFEAIGTQWQIDIMGQRAQHARADLSEAIKKRIDEFDRNYSRFRVDSWVAGVSKTAGSYRVPPDDRILMDTYAALYHLTGGAFTLLIGDTLAGLGYDAEYSLVVREARAPSAWEEALEYQYPCLEVKKAVVLDFGAAGKGHIIDSIGELMEAQGITQYCIDAGGDIKHRDSMNTSIRVGLENPYDTQQVIGVASVRNQSICCSSGNRRKWGKYHHIIDPRTLASPSHIASVWTIADTTLVADAMATCLFLVDAKVLRERFDFEYCIMKPDREVECSPGFTAEFFE